MKPRKKPALRTAPTTVGSPRTQPRQRSSSAQDRSERTWQLPQEPSRNHTTPARFLQPYVVTFRDLQRYLSRAAEACTRGRVIYFHRHGRWMQMALAERPDIVQAASLAFAAGKCRHVRLADLPLKPGRNPQRCDAAKSDDGFPAHIPNRDTLAALAEKPGKTFHSAVAALAHLRRDATAAKGTKGNTLRRRTAKATRTPRQNSPSAPRP